MVVIDNIIIVPHRFEVFLYDLIDFMSPDEKLKLFFADFCVFDCLFWGTCPVISMCIIMYSLLEKTKGSKSGRLSYKIYIIDKEEKKDRSL